MHAPSGGPVLIDDGRGPSGSLPPSSNPSFTGHPLSDGDPSREFAAFHNPGPGGGQRDAAFHPSSEERLLDYQMRGDHPSSDYPGSGPPTTVHRGNSGPNLGMSVPAFPQYQDKSMGGEHSSLEKEAAQAILMNNNHHGGYRGGQFDGMPPMPGMSGMPLPSGGLPALLGDHGLGDVDVTVMAYAQWLSEMKQQATNSRYQAQAELDLMRDAINANNNELVDFKRHSSTVQQQLQGQVSELRSKLGELFSEVSVQNRTRTETEQRTSASLSSLREALTSRQSEMETRGREQLESMARVQEEVARFDARFQHSDSELSLVRKALGSSQEQTIQKFAEVDKAMTLFHSTVNTSRTELQDTKQDWKKGQDLLGQAISTLSQDLADFQKHVSTVLNKLQSDVYHFEELERDDRDRSGRIEAQLTGIQQNLYSTANEMILMKAEKDKTEKEAPVAMMGISPDRRQHGIDGSGGFRIRHGDGQQQAAGGQPGGVVSLPGSTQSIGQSVARQVTELEVMVERDGGPSPGGGGGTPPPGHAVIVSAANQQHKPGAYPPAVAAPPEINRRASEPPFMHLQAGARRASLQPMAGGPPMMGQTMAGPPPGAPGGPPPMVSQMGASLSQSSLHPSGPPGSSPMASPMNSMSNLPFQQPGMMSGMRPSLGPHAHMVPMGGSPMGPPGRARSPAPNIGMFQTVPM